MARPTVPAKPFADWLRSRVERYEREAPLMGDVTHAGLGPNKRLARELGIAERTLNRYMNCRLETKRDGKGVTFDTDVYNLHSVDEMLRNAGFYLWDVYAEKNLHGFCAKCAELVPVSDQGHCFTCWTQTGAADEGDARKTRHPYRACSEEILLEARRLYIAGATVPAIARRLFPRTGYKNVESFRRCLYDNFHARGWRTRGKNGAHNLVHGRAAGHRNTPEIHAEYQRWWRRQQAPRCSRTTRKGTPCTYRALDGKDVCHIHDEERGAVYLEMLRRGRETLRRAA